MTSRTEDDERRSPCTVAADELPIFEFAVAAEVWTGDMTKGSTALARNASSSGDMPFSRLGLSALISVLHDTSLMSSSCFKGNG